jgi:hypothetical protein
MTQQGQLQAEVALRRDAPQLRQARAAGGRGPLIVGRVDHLSAEARLLGGGEAGGRRDIHLVIRDKHKEHTLIVEFVNPMCPDEPLSSKAAEMGNARAAFVEACGKPSSTNFTQLEGAPRSKVSACSTRSTRSRSVGKHRTTSSSNRCSGSKARPVGPVNRRAPLSRRGVSPPAGTR